MTSEVIHELAVELTNTSEFSADVNPLSRAERPVQSCQNKGK